MLIELTPAQVLQAAQAGIMRQTYAIRQKLKPAYGASTKNDWQLHVEGCLGEMVVAQYLNRFWDGTVGITQHGDVGRIEVRTSSRDNGDLIMHDRDPDDNVFILVTGRNGRYKIRGWTEGRDGKKKEFWSDPAGGRPAYFVPQDELIEIEKLYKSQNV